MSTVRLAKIVATLGPATSSQEMIEDLADAGANVFRLNFSHGSHDDHRKTHAAIRAAEKVVGHPLGILMDLQGPKLRVGTFKGDGIVLQRDATWRLDLDPAAGDETRVCLPHPEIFAALKPGSTLLIDDGHLRLEVLDCGPDFATTKVIIPGAVSNRKGVNVPDVALEIPAMTEKDRADLKFGVDELGVDWVALSFVQKAADVREVKDLVEGRAGVVAKLEKPGAIDDLDAIIDTADAVMVARGDLGVEAALESVPMLQKRIIQAARDQGKPVIVATQMLESMIQSPVPTRAEASDVATAVYDGADAVMLSAESAVGQYPVRAVATMARIIGETEKDPYQRTLFNATRSTHEETISDSITAAARQIADTLDTAAIVTFTTSGSTTLRAARERPNAPILCLTTNADVARKMALVWGVRPLLNDSFTQSAHLGRQALAAAKSINMIKSGQCLVLTAGLPFGMAGSTNMLRVVTEEGLTPEG